MNPSAVNIKPINYPMIKSSQPEKYTIIWIKDTINKLEINGISYENVSNSLFFIDPINKWLINKNNNDQVAGYIMYLTAEILNHPLLSKLHINQVRLFHSGEIPMINLSPGIETRIQSILEMLDELIGSNLQHKDDAILALLNTFFVYCDGKCNIKSSIDSKNTKANIVYSFKKLVDKRLSEHHQVSDYANLLNISPKYLNECVKEVLGVSAKSIITEQLLMRSRHALKFSNKTIKEISYYLGFSSPDYFNYFIKNQTGNSPTFIKNG